MKNALALFLVSATLALLGPGARLPQAGAVPSRSTPSRTLMGQGGVDDILLAIARWIACGMETDDDRGHPPIPP